MRKLILTTLITAPTLLMASEPASGTLIQISGVGGFVLLSSLWMLWQQRKNK